MSVKGASFVLGKVIVTSLTASAIELGYFSQAPRIFLWKSRDSAEKILRSGMLRVARGKKSGMALSIP